MKSIALYIKKKSIFIGLKFCKIDFYVQIIFDLVLPLKNGKTLACPFNCCLNPPKANDKLDPKHWINTFLPQGTFSLPLIVFFSVMTYFYDVQFSIQIFYTVSYSNKQVLKPMYVCPFEGYNN